jgi:hypothetical protein
MRGNLPRNAHQSHHRNNSFSVRIATARFSTVFVPWSTTSGQNACLNTRHEIGVEAEIGDETRFVRRELGHRTVAATGQAGSEQRDAKKNGAPQRTVLRERLCRQRHIQ